MIINKKGYQNYLREHVNDIKSESTISKYCSALRTICGKINAEDVDVDLLNVKDYQELINKISYIKNNSKFNEIAKMQHSTFGRALAYLEQYLQHLNCETIKDCKGVCKIYYGAPGTGKSYKANLLAKELCREENIIRTTVYPDYDYSDFVVSIKPVKEEDSISYDIVGGPFAKALKLANDKPNENVVLIVEEMTRGNIAGIFGDIFQLLDRNEEGVSEYPIKNDMLSKFLKRDGDIVIPSNLSIIGTVNTSDQNVYVMDTAFKRRFDFEYVSIDLNDDQNDFEFKITNDSNQQINISWKIFRNVLNDYILDNCNLNEDKCLGSFFIKKDKNNDVENNTETIKNKVLHYIWDDIDTLVYDDNNKILNGKKFSDIYNGFKDKNIFTKKFNEKLNEKLKESIADGSQNELEDDEK